MVHGSTFESTPRRRPSRRSCRASRTPRPRSVVLMVVAHRANGDQPSGLGRRAVRAIAEDPLASIDPAGRHVATVNPVATSWSGVGFGQRSPPSCSIVNWSNGRLSGTPPSRGTAIERSLSRCRPWVSAGRRRASAAPSLAERGRTEAYRTCSRTIAMMSRRMSFLERRRQSVNAVKRRSALPSARRVIRRRADRQERVDRVPTQPTLNAARALGWSLNAQCFSVACVTQRTIALLIGARGFCTEASSQVGGGSADNLALIGAGNDRRRADIAGFGRLAAVEHFGLLLARPWQRKHVSARSSTSRLKRRSSPPRAVASTGSGETPGRQSIAPSQPHGNSHASGQEPGVARLLITSITGAKPRVDVPTRVCGLASFPGFLFLRKGEKASGRAFETPVRILLRFLRGDFRIRFSSRRDIGK